MSGPATGPSVQVLAEGPKLNHTDSSLRCGLDLVLGVGVVERRGERVDRRALQGELAVGALALDAVDAVAEVLRHRIGVGRIGTVGDVLRARRARLRNRAPVVLVAGERAPAVADRRLVEAGVALLVARAERDAELVVAERLAEDAGDFRRDRHRPAGDPAGCAADVSITPLTPKLVCRPGLSSGRAVLMLIVAPMPPVGVLARLVL